MRHHVAVHHALKNYSPLLFLLLCLSAPYPSGPSFAEDPVGQTSLPTEPVGQPATGTSEQPATSEMTLPVPEPEPGDIESRGMPKIQRPVQPGMPVAPGAPAQQKFQLPTWPQKFAIEDRRPASFGIAVTQPGPVIIEVQWQGAPIEATLRGPAAQPIVQRGQGQLRVVYHVTPEDVQKGVLWVVNLALLSAAKGQAAGQVTVQQPAVNAVQAEAAVRARVEQIKQQNQLNQAQIQAHIQSIVQIHKNEDARQYQEHLNEAALKADTFLKQKGFQGQVQSRALPPPRDGARISPKLPPEALRARPEFEPPPPPRIDSLSVTYAQPGARVVIYGSGFTNRVGHVLMTTTNAAVQPEARVVQGASGPIWTDTLIEVNVPEMTGVTHFNSSLFVVVEGDPSGPLFSNAAPFLFVPRQQSRVLTMVSPFDRRLANHTTYSQETGGFANNASVVGNEIHHVRLFEPFAGRDGRDWFFENTALQNGWRVTCVEVIPYDLRSCNPTNTVYGIPFGTGAYVAQSDQTLKLQVRWWFEPFIPAMSYTYLFVLRGPENVPDGVLCRTVAGCSAP